MIAVMIVAMKLNKIDLIIKIKVKMDYLQVLKVFRRHYGKNQKYYSDIHPILYYSDEIFTNPFSEQRELEKEKSLQELKKYFNNYKIGYRYTTFFPLFLRVLRDLNFKMREDDVIEKMVHDFDNLNLAREYNLYEVKISKTKMRNILINKQYNTYEFIKFCCEYFSFIIHIISADNVDIFYPRNDVNILAPKIFIFQDLEGSYHHIQVDGKNYLDHSNTSYFDYFCESNNKDELIIQSDNDSEDQPIVQEQPKEEIKQPEFDVSKLLKMKLTELQKIATDMNLSIEKLNKNKTKMIKKKKDELVHDILKG